MAIEIVSFPIKNGGSFHSYVSLPNGNHHYTTTLSHQTRQFRWSKVDQELGGQGPRCSHGIYGTIHMGHLGREFPPVNYPLGNGTLMGFIYSDSMGFYSDFNGIYSDFMGFTLISWDFIVISMGFYSDFNGIYSDLMGFTLISWDFIVI